MNKKQTNSENSSKNVILTRFQTANFFQVSVRTIDSWTQLGYLTPSKVGRKIYYYQSDLFNLLDSNR